MDESGPKYRLTFWVGTVVGSFSEPEVVSAAGGLGEGERVGVDEVYVEVKYPACLRS